jgi:hypothetical protein
MTCVDWRTPSSTLTRLRPDHTSGVPPAPSGTGVGPRRRIGFLPFVVRRAFAELNRLRLKVYMPEKVGFVGAVFVPGPVLVPKAAKPRHYVVWGRHPQEHP